MRLIEGKAEIIITPNSQFARRVIDEHILSKGTHQLHDAIKETISYNGHSNDNLSFKFSGIYPNQFEDYEEAKLFKESIEALVEKTNDTSGNFKIKNIDDILFITYFFVGYDGDVYSSNANNKYLDELIDVFMEMLERNLTPTEGDCIWVPNELTGIEIQVPKAEFGEDELKMRGGYRVVSRMIGANNAVFQLPSDGAIVIDKRKGDKEPIVLPNKLSEKVNAMIVDHIIEEHKKVNSQFYRDLCCGYLDKVTWGKGRDKKASNAKRKNKILYELILVLEDYFRSLRSPYPAQHSFIYELFICLKILKPSTKVRDAKEKSSAIRTIIQYNKSTCSGN